MLEFNREDVATVSALFQYAENRVMLKLCVIAC